MKIIFLVLWRVSFIACLIWAIGFPIYRKINHRKIFEDFQYATWLLIGSMFLNIFSLLMRVC